ncbi:family 1 encapsulin nanocompartment shell protein [Streptomyces sp. NPDC052051]|uniref:family 1 encapsulin nanocompartment shell protein n=1 Tax=Streptomyces sp. NPDC052051 TaxID=3154649 RepID=UPI003441E2C3
MDNLHRELAPVSAAAWADLEDEARRTFTRHVAARRIVDMPATGGLDLAGVGSGHLQGVEVPADGVEARLRRFQPLVELRVPFTVDRQQVDDVARGAKDADWQPVKDAARKLAIAEDRAVFEGYAAAHIVGLRESSSNPALTLPTEVSAYPDAVSKALTVLRLAGVGGPYALALSAEAYTAVSETSDYGYPIINHIARVLDGDIVWAPAIDGAFLLSRRGGDFALHLGQDVSIGYLSHDEHSIRLYFQETLTFLVHTSEAVVPLEMEPPWPAEQLEPLEAET